MSHRLDFIDHTRTLLIGLVVLVHAAITYGGEGEWYFREQANSAYSSMILTVFNAVSQSFFMSLLFLISGYFTGRSLSQQKLSGYLFNRITRLGIPLGAYYFLLGPLVIFQAFDLNGLTPPPYNERLHTGPMWFVQALLIFTLTYLLFALVQPRAASVPKQQIPFTWFSVILFIMLLWVTAIPARAQWPMGHGIAGMQLGSFSHYAIMFALGISANRVEWQNWLLSVPASDIKTVLVSATLIMPFTLYLFVSESQGFEPFKGGLTWQSILYTAWESIMCVTLSLFLLIKLQNRVLRPAKLWNYMAKANYGVYLIHPPVLLIVTALLLPLDWAPLIKFLINSLLTLIISFSLAGLLIRLPVIQKIL